MDLTRAACQPSLGAMEPSTSIRKQIFQFKVWRQDFFFFFWHLSSGTEHVHAPTCLLLHGSLRFGSRGWQTERLPQEALAGCDGCVTAATANLRLIYSVLCVSRHDGEAGACSPELIKRKPPLQTAKWLQGSGGAYWAISSWSLKNWAHR